METVSLQNYRKTYFLSFNQCLCDICLWNFCCNRCTLCVSVCMCACSQHKALHAAMNSIAASLSFTLHDLQNTPWTAFLGVISLVSLDYPQSSQQCAWKDILQIKIFDVTFSKQTSQSVSSAKCFECRSSSHLMLWWRLTAKSPWVRFPGQDLSAFCVESPRVCMGSLPVLRLLPTVQRHRLWYLWLEYLPRCYAIMDYFHVILNISRQSHSSCSLNAAHKVIWRTKADLSWTRTLLWCCSLEQLRS